MYSNRYIHSDNSILHEAFTLLINIPKGLIPYKVSVLAKKMYLIDGRVPIERVEGLEEKYGVVITANARYGSQEHTISVVGEIFASQLEKDINITASLYNESGSIIDTSFAIIHKDGFIGISNFLILLHSNKSWDTNCKIRVYPK